MLFKKDGIIIQELQPPSLRKTKSHPIRKLSSHLMNHGFFKKNLDFRSSHGINLGYVHGIFMGIYYNGMLLSGNSLYPLVNINIAMENHDV